MQMSEKYILTMDKETALMVDRACEFYSRMVMGQFGEAATQVFETWPENLRMSISVRGGILLNHI